MRKIFLDVGGFNGESARAALDPIFAFDAVYCFEPVKALAKSIEAEISDKRLVVAAAGLFDKTGSLRLGNPGDLGGSVYSDDGGSELCDFVRASDFFETTIQPGDQVWMKLNCEGAELNILTDLLDSGQAEKLQEVLIDLDAAKYPALHPAAEVLLERLKTAPFDYHYPPEVQYGSVNNFGGIRQWLTITGAATPSIAARLASVAYNVPLGLDRQFNGYHKIRLLRFLGLRPPPQLVPVEARNTWSPLHQQRGPLEQ